MWTDDDGTGEAGAEWEICPQHFDCSSFLSFGFTFKNMSKNSSYNVSRKNRMCFKFRIAAFIANEFEGAHGKKLLL